MAKHVYVHVCTYAHVHIVRRDSINQVLCAIYTTETTEVKKNKVNALAADATYMAGIHSEGRKVGMELGYQEKR